MKTRERNVYEFGTYRLLPHERLLLRDGQPVALTPKAFDTLVALVERSGRLVEKQELLEVVWPEANVEEATIAQNVFAVRRALGAPEDGQKYIETVAKRGYRFVPAVRIVGNAGDAPRVEVPSHEPTLVVLPLTFLGTADPAEGEYLGVAMADAFITRLSSGSGLTVRPTASVMHYAGTNALDAGRELKAHAVLDGKCRRIGDALRVTLQLIAVRDGSLLWAETFDGRMSELFALEDAISAKLASVVVPELTARPEEALVARGTENPRAYAAYWRGRYYWNQFRPEFLPKAIAEFETAIALDPQFARAYLGIADAYNWSSIFGIVPTAECIEHSTAAARRALELDPMLGDAYSALGFVTGFYVWDWEEAERLLIRALELNPNDALAHEWYAGLLAGCGRLDELRPILQRTEELNPLSLRTRAMLAWQTYHAHDFERAVSIARELVALNDQFPQAYMQLGNALEQTGDAEGAVAALERALELHPDSGLVLYPLCFALVRSGRRDEARAVLEKLRDGSSVQGMKSYFTAMAHVALGEHDAALRAFQRALDERDPWMFWIVREAKLRPLQNDARFIALQDAVVPRHVRGVVSRERVLAAAR